MSVYGPYKDSRVTDVWINMSESDEQTVILQSSQKPHKDVGSLEERDEACVSSVVMPLSVGQCQCLTACLEQNVAQIKMC